MHRLPTRSLRSALPRRPSRSALPVALGVALLAVVLGCDPGPRWRVEDDFAQAEEGTPYVPGTRLELRAYLDEGFRGDQGVFFEPPDVAVSQDESVFVVDGELGQDGEAVLIPIRATGPGEAYLELRFEGEGGELAALHKVRVTQPDEARISWWDAPSRAAGRDPLVIDGGIAPLARGIHELVVEYRDGQRLALGRGALEVQGPAWVQALGATGSDDDAVLLTPPLAGPGESLVLAVGGRAIRQLDVAPASLDDIDRLEVAALSTEPGQRKVLRAEVDDRLGRAILGANCSWWLDGAAAGQGDGVAYYETGGTARTLDVKCGSAQARLEVFTSEVDVLVTNPIPSYSCDLDGTVLDDTLLEDIADLFGC